MRVFPAAPAGPGAATAPSCVLRVAARGGRGTALLVPAQVDRAEATLLASRAARQALRAEVVLAPRRGSPAAITPAFVAAVGAREVLVARRNLDDPQRRRIAPLWRVADGRVRATGRDGALVVGQRQAGGEAEVVRLVDRQPRWIWRLPRD